MFGQLTCQCYAGCTGADDRYGPTKLILRYLPRINDQLASGSSCITPTATRPLEPKIEAHFSGKVPFAQFAIRGLPKA
jgi:hypothetical protein